MTDARARWRIEAGVGLEDLCLEGTRIVWRDGRDTNLRIDRSGAIIDADSGATLATIRVEHCLYSMEGVRVGALDLWRQVEDR